MKKKQTHISFLLLPPPEVATNGVCAEFIYYNYIVIYYYYCQLVFYCVIVINDSYLREVVIVEAWRAQFVRIGFCDVARRRAVRVPACTRWVTVCSNSKRRKKCQQ